MRKKLFPKMFSNLTLLNCYQWRIYILILYTETVDSTEFMMIHKISKYSPKQNQIKSNQIKANKTKLKLTKKAPDIKQ